MRTLLEDRAPTHGLLDPLQPHQLRRLALTVAGLLATLPALAQNPYDDAPPAPVAAPTAVAFEPTLQPLDGGGARIIVGFTRKVEITELPALGRVVYRIKGARGPRAGGLILPPDDGGPIARIELVAHGSDLDLIIDVRRVMGVRPQRVESSGRFELRVDVLEVAGKPGALKPGVSMPEAPKPPRPPPAPPKVAPRPSAPRASSSDEGERTLGGVTFLSPSKTDSAFVTSHLGIALGFKTSSFFFPTSSGKERFRLHLAGLEEQLDAGVLLPGRVGLFASLGGFTAVGIDSASALELGADGGFTWSAGVAATVLRSASTGTQIGARMAIQGGRAGRIVSLQRLFEGAADTRKVPTADDLFSSRSSAGARFSLNVAQAILRHVSAQLSLGWSVDRTSFGGPEAPVAYTKNTILGMALGGDLSPWFPLAVQIEYTLHAPFGRSFVPVGTDTPALLLADAYTHAVSGGLYFTGRRDLLLGLLAGREIHLLGERHFSQGGRFELRYFF